MTNEEGQAYYNETFPLPANTHPADADRLWRARYFLDVADYLERKAEGLCAEARRYRARAIAITTPHERDKLRVVAEPKAAVLAEKSTP